mgnify:CR=1 FL=1
MARTRTVLGAVIASTFFVGFGGGVVFPILPNLGEILGITPVVVGLILSANRFTRIVANTPAGAIIDRVGARTPLVVGMAIQSAATFGYVLAMGAENPAAWFVVARVGWGVGSAFVFATAFTIAADVSDGRSRGLNMGVIRGGLLMGFPAGLVLGGVVSDFYSVTAAFALATAFAVVATVVAYAVVPETHVAEHRAGIKPWEVDRAPSTLVVGLVNFGLFFAFLGALLSTLVLFVDAKDLLVWGFGPQATSGVFMAVTMLASSGFMLGGGRYSDLVGNRVPVLLVFIVVSFGGFALLAVADSLPTLLAACVLIGAGQGGTSGPLMALLADLTPAERMGRATATNNLLGDLGAGIGPLLSRPLIDVVGFQPVYAASAVVPLLAGAVLMVGLYRQTGSVIPATGGD